MLPWAITFSVSIIWIVAEGICAYFDGWLTLAQMKAQKIEQGIFFLGHTGVWSDAVLLTPLLATMVWMSSDQWSIGEISLAFAAAVLLSVLMHWDYAQDPVPTVFAHDGKMTLSGILHFGYTVASLTIIILFFTATMHTLPLFVLAAAAILMVHVAFGVYIPLKIWTPEWCPYHGVLNARTVQPVLVSLLAFAGATWYALR